ncbi:hypothetical protein B0T44_23530 [Nocardia donostiensis]|uniref:Uncharacterized protein n=1 Tax=Nocardia donostiensis TaxID=1538463 RepID=A0A1W0B5K1_9NOCA|nr:hypothetical protein B0T46_14510 [Nocardia donostiensis]OQS13820.1 hypothetical protein B0T36_16870 [Nocardia donostiensis]OQS17696.1 hypothetical protein B0T44_23530 [Nocardia donostiensis]
MIEPASVLDELAALGAALVERYGRRQVLIRRALFVGESGHYRTPKETRNADARPHRRIHLHHSRRLPAVAGRTSRLRHGDLVEDRQNNAPAATITITEACAVARRDGRLPGRAATADRMIDKEARYTDSSPTATGSAGHRYTVGGGPEPARW